MSAARIACLLGPTGTGKTGTVAAMAALADTASPLPIAVVNFDSRQVYRDFPIITAQPTPEERAVCPHLLYGFLETDRTITAAAFTDMAHEAIVKVAAMGRLPVLVGGTGLYLKALLQGLAPIPDVPADIHEATVAEVREKGAPALHRDLAAVDPVTAERLHPNDTQRIARALEVFRASGHPLSHWHTLEHPKADYDALKLGIRLDLDELTPKLAARIDEMLAMGAVDEARRALEICPDPEAPGWTGIGCAELGAYLRGDIDLERARYLWTRNTRAYAKRQITWCRKERGMHWFAPGEPERVAAFVRAWMEGGPLPESDATDGGEGGGAE